MKKLLFAGLLICVQSLMNAQTTNTAPAQTTITPIPAEVILPLFERVNQVDFIFNTLPITTSADGNNAKSTIQLMTVNAPKTIGCTKPLANVIFTDNIKGEMLMEGTIYFANGCTYWELKHNGTTYYNQMSAQGINYLNQVVTQANKKNTGNSAH